MGMKDVEVKISLHNDYYCMNCERSDLVEEFYQNLTNLIMIEPYHYSGGKTTKLGNDQTVDDIVGMTTPADQGFSIQSGSEKEYRTKLNSNLLIGDALSQSLDSLHNMETDGGSFASSRLSDFKKDASSSQNLNFFGLTVKLDARYHNLTAFLTRKAQTQLADAKTALAGHLALTVDADAAV